MVCCGEVDGLVLGAVAYYLGCGVVLWLSTMTSWIWSR